MHKDKLEWKSHFTCAIHTVEYLHNCNAFACNLQGINAQQKISFQKC